MRHHSCLKGILSAVLQSWVWLKLSPLLCLINITAVTVAYFGDIASEKPLGLNVSKTLVILRQFLPQFTSAIVSITIFALLTVFPVTTFYIFTLFVCLSFIFIAVICDSQEICVFRPMKKAKLLYLSYNPQSRERSTPPGGCQTGPVGGRGGVKFSIKILHVLFWLWTICIHSR